MEVLDHIIKVEVANNGTQGDQSRLFVPSERDTLEKVLRDRDIKKIHMCEFY